MTFKEKFHSQNSNWKEKVLIISVFHSKRCIETNNNWSLKDSAKYFEVSVGLISEDLNLARNIELVEECKSRASALKKMNHSDKR